METKKQTAVEYYDDIVLSIIQEFLRDEITKTELIVKIHKAYYPAIIMEKQHIAMAYNDGRVNAGLKLNRTAQDYYTSTYE
jgi:hypothetical protein